MTGAFQAAWLMLLRRAIILPAFGAIVLFSIMSITFTFSTSAAPGGSRLTVPPTTLADLAGADTLAMMVGRPIMVVGLVVLAASILHITGQYSSGLIRVQFIRQPRRAVWLLGNWLALACATAIATAVSVLTVLGTAAVCAAVWQVDTSLWGEGAGQIAGATANLLLAMVVFSLAGSTLGLWLRSSVAALATGLVYALFENLINSVAPFGQGLLPVAAFTTVATSGMNGNPYITSLIATSVFGAVLVVGAVVLVRSRNVTD